MSIKYKIIANQNFIETEYKGEVQNHDELQVVLKSVYDKFDKGTPASVELTYKEATEEQIKNERERIKSIVTEEFNKMKENGEI